MQGLRIQLIAPFVAGTLALTLFLSGYTYTSARRAVGDAMLLISEAKTNQALSSVNLLLKSMSTSLQNMVIDPHATAVFSKEHNAATLTQATEWLETLIQGNEYYRDILIVDQNGICIVSSNPGQIGASYAEQPGTRQALSGRFALGETSVGRVTKKLSAVMAGPIDVGGELVGALILVNDFPKIVDYEAGTTHDAQIIFTAMLTPEGQFVAHKNKDFVGTSTRFPELYQQAVDVGEQGGEVSYQLLGRTYVGYAKVIPANRWIVLTSGMQSEVFASAYEVGLVVFGVSLLFLCGISFVVIRFANGILSSLLSLIAYAKKVSEGDFELDLEATRRTDELGVLHTALQRLVRALRAMLVETREASKMKGEFLANMSHEIRTPLNAILGMSHLALREGNLPDRLRGFIDTIQLAARSLLGLINDILDLSKVEAGMIELEQTSFNLRDVIENTLSIHQEAAQGKSLRFEYEYDLQTPSHFLGDPLRIGQILNNLISNAIKFTKEGGVIIRCRLTDNASCGTASNAMPHAAPNTSSSTASHATPDNPDTPHSGSSHPNSNDERVTLCLSVSDTGIGISQEVLATLFQPFTQADASITRQFGGTGLGLAISDKLVRLLGGTFTVDSEPGKGTTFSFTICLLPDHEGAHTSSEAVPLDTAFERLGLAGKSILVAEDNAINQIIMQELIEPSGARVFLAANGQEAVEAARKEHFDLVFMDLQMPVLDGFEATRRIREFADAATLPIVAVTANAMREDKEKGFAIGMNDYITKPVEPMHLLNMLRFWLKKFGTDPQAGGPT